jgi:alkanesulfonate monooxygenase SsuD/methylene tetrahydromethanopterin reductase-like flavin-dependent oxidoreductase (luciferase family)
VIEGNRARQFVGTPGEVAGLIRQIAEEVGADEAMVTTMIYDVEARSRSYEMLASAWRAQW